MLITKPNLLYSVFFLYCTTTVVLPCYPPSTVGGKGSVSVTELLYVWFYGNKTILRFLVNPK